MHSLNHLPKELLYPCVTGSPDLSNKAALKIFLLSGIQLTCLSLSKLVEESALQVFMNIYPALGTVSRQFRCNWILGRPKISDPFKPDRLEALSLNDLFKKMKTAALQPIHFRSKLRPADLLTYINFEQKISFIDLKNSPTFTKNLQPLFYEDNTMFFMNDEIHFNDFIHSLPTTQSMQLLEDQLILETNGDLVIFSIEQLKTSNKPLGYLPNELQGAKFLKSINGELLLYKYDQTHHFYKLYKQDTEIRLLECPITYPDSLRNPIHQWQHVFHKEANCTVFLFYTLFRYQLGFTLNKSGLQKVMLSSEIDIRSSKLVEFQNAALLCYLDYYSHLQLERIDIQNDIIKQVPLVLNWKKNWKFTYILDTHVHLDRLFIIGTTCSNREGTCHHLIIIDMATLSVESITKLMAAKELETSLISSDLGKVHVLLPNQNTVNIFNIDYT